MTASAIPPVAPPATPSASSSTTQLGTPCEIPASLDEKQHAIQQAKTEGASPGHSTPLYAKDELLIREFETSCGKMPAETTAEDLRAAFMRTYGFDFPLEFVTDMSFEMQSYGISKVFNTPTWKMWLRRKVVEICDAKVEKRATKEEDDEEGQDNDPFDGEAMAESFDDLVLFLTVPPDLILALAEAGLVQEWYLKRWDDLKEYIPRPEPIRPTPCPATVDYVLLILPSEVYKLLCDKNILRLDYHNGDTVRKALEMREAMGLEPMTPDWDQVHERVKRARARGVL